MSITARPNGRQVDDIVTAAVVLEDVWTRSHAWENAGHLTCGEVDTLAELFRALGADELADNMIEWHSHSDEPGDAHHYERVGLGMVKSLVETGVFDVRAAQRGG